MWAASTCGTRTEPRQDVESYPGARSNLHGLSEDVSGRLVGPAFAPRNEPRVPDAVVKQRSQTVNIFYIIGVVVVVLFILGYFGLR